MRTTTNTPTTPAPLTLEALTATEARQQVQAAADHTKTMQQRQELQRRAAAPLAAGRRAADIFQGVLFATEESLFSGMSQERREATALLLQRL